MKMRGGLTRGQGASRAKEDRQSHASLLHQSFSLQEVSRSLSQDELMYKGFESNGVI